MILSEKDNNYIKVNNTFKQISLQNDQDRVIFIQSKDLYEAKNMDDELVLRAKRSSTTAL